MMSRRVGRPDFFDWDEIKDLLDEYISSTEDPQLKEFCLGKLVPGYDALNERAKTDGELSQLVKDLIAKQEVYLTRQGGAMSIFRLKQACHGFRDTQVVDYSLTSMQRVIDIQLIDSND
jgi:hypothetical protein